MKKLFRTAINVIAVMLMAVCALGLTACEDTRTIEITLRLYNNADSTFYSDSESTLTVELCRYLAPKTVDAVIEHIRNGYYDNAVFYQDKSESSVLFVGDLKFEGGELKQNLINGKLPSEIYGEFESNGTIGSNLSNQKGSVAIWRSYYEQDSGLATSSNARNSGRATLTMPTASKSAYDGYICVVGKYDADDETNKSVVSAISAIFSTTSYFSEYIIYYTGEYDAAKPDENYGLTFHAVKADDFDDETEVFEAEGKQLVCFNKKTVWIPNAVDGECTAMIKSVKVK
ncbi:MAG: peptidylprolyl isomerase [Clostridia bacterium]|nr:peptidylprolyl isomerase [Clostridia bacterium]